MPAQTTVPPTAHAPVPQPVSEDSAETLLELARALARELQPRRRAAWRGGLDGSLDHEWGFDSLSRAEPLLRVEREFRVRLPEALLGGAETLRDVLSALGSAAAAPPAYDAKVRRRLAEEAAEPAPAGATTLIEVLEWHVRHHGQRGARRPLTRRR